MGLVISHHSGAPNGWSSVNDGDVVITVENPENSSYKLDSITMNLAKGVGTVMDYYGILRTGSSSATVQAYFCVGDSSGGTRATNLVTVTNTVSVRKESSGSASDPSGYFNPTSVSYTFNFISPVEISSGGTRKFTLCNSMTTNGILSWANKSSTPPAISSSPAVLPGSPTLTNPVVSVDSPVLVGQSTVPTIVSACVSTTSPTSSITYWWYTRTYDQNGVSSEWTYTANSITTSGIIPPTPQEVVSTISSTISRVDTKVYATILDSRYEVPSKTSDEVICSCLGKCVTPTILSVLVSPNSAGNTISCQASPGGGSSFSVEYRTYYSLFGSTIADLTQPMTDWTSSDQVVVVSVPDLTYDGIVSRIKTVRRPAYLDSDEISSSKVIIYFSPRNISSHWSSAPTWSFSSGANLVVSTDVVRISPPTIQLDEHVGNFNYYKLALVNAGTNTEISSFGIEGPRESEIDLTLINYYDIFKSQAGNTLKFRLYTYYSYNGNIIDDVSLADQGLNSTYIESPTFTASVGSITIVSQFPDLSMNLNDRITYNENLFVSFRVSSNDSTNNPVRQVVFTDDYNYTYTINNVDTVVASDYGSDLINGSGRNFAAWVTATNNSSRRIRMGFVNGRDFAFILPQTATSKILRSISIQATLLDGTTTEILSNAQFYYEPYGDYPDTGDPITASSLAKLNCNFSKALNAHRLHAGFSRVLPTDYTSVNYQGKICNVDTADLRFLAQALIRNEGADPEDPEYAGYLWTLVSGNGNGAQDPLSKITELYPMSLNNTMVVRWFQISSRSAVGDPLALENDAMPRNTNKIFSSLVTFLRKYL